MATRGILNPSQKNTVVKDTVLNRAIFTLKKTPSPFQAKSVHQAKNPTKEVGEKPPQEKKDE